MSAVIETKMIQFSDSLLISQTENSDTQIYYLNDFGLKIFENLHCLHFLYLDKQQCFVEPLLQLRDNWNKDYTLPLDLYLIV